MRQAFFVCILLALIASATAVHPPTNRKMLTLNGQQTAQQWGPRNDRGWTQLAANNRAIVNTQLAIEDAVNSGANPYVTESAARYGNYQAYKATQVNRRCGWWGGVWYPCRK